MDIEDHQHFRQMAAAPVKPQGDSRTKPAKETLNLVRDPAYCLDRAKILFGCYRKDEVSDPDIYCSAVAAVLSEYEKPVIDYVTDPRTGLPSEPDSRFGIPNIGKVREACNQAAERARLNAQPKRVAVPFVPPPLRPGEINSKTFDKMVAEGKLIARPIGRFESADDEWNRSRGLLPVAPLQKNELMADLLTQEKNG